MLSIEQLSEQLIEEACVVNASDLHIIPRDDDALIQLRIDDDIIEKHTMNKKRAERMIAYFKFLSSMDIGEKRKPQNGSLSFKTKAIQVNLRFSTLPTINDESLVIRIFPQKMVPALQKLSLFPTTTNKLLSLINYSHGLIIFTGPTGSGKTTTLYSLLHYAKEHFHRNIITLEDPVETKSDQVLQVQVNEKAGMTYSAGLKAILRHDPDMIMVGEIRDSETAKIAIRASLTGHLVLSTMHTRDARGAIYRLLEFGVGLSEIEQTLIAVSAQRLVELVCPFCEGRCTPFCKSLRKTRRLGVFELLYGKNLTSSIREVRGERVSYNYLTLKDAMKKGVSLGYLTQSSYNRWIYADEE
ncbi:competence type IV pilus ATPase ComGA [Bacillus carboniphilus]|uniref:Competence type IV pilus ATPase ComGA n=1 Tax=Bacillus carboniphilus TaxID=86663 RepID=A0ABY9K011_9BACI|nr:competence type IV pilus ATPase ComGA [Bacillus carboniphilus]WLR43923.1 competence type IV pilus ATPase ComGA [Bacillus carboniphilus]